MKKSKIAIVREFVKSIDSNYRVRYSNQCECDIDNEVIYINFKMDNEVEKIFESFCKKTFGEVFPRVLISILHEVGHIETFDDDRNEERYERYALLQILWDNTEIDKETLHHRYYNLPGEIEATTWAVDYIRNNRKKCENFLKMLDL